MEGNVTTNIKVLSLRILATWERQVWLIKYRTQKSWARDSLGQVSIPEPFNCDQVMRWHKNMQAPSRAEHGKISGRLVGYVKQIVPYITLQGQTLRRKLPQKSSA